MTDPLRSLRGRILQHEAEILEAAVHTKFVDEDQSYLREKLTEAIENYNKLVVDVDKLIERFNDLEKELEDFKNQTVAQIQSLSGGSDATGNDLPPYVPLKDRVAKATAANDAAGPVQPQEIPGGKKSRSTKPSAKTA